MSKLDGMQAFVRVVELQSFAAAAGECGLSRSQINRSVVALEDHLGVQLLHRTTRRVVPTTVGQQYFDRCKLILGDIADADAEATSTQANPKGVLHINGPISFGNHCLAPAIAEFSRAYPEIRLSLTLSDTYIDPLEQGFDLTVRIGRRQDYVALIDHEVCTVSKIICASPGFLGREGTPESLRDLERLPCLHYGAERGQTYWDLVGPDGPVMQRVNWKISSTSGDMLKRAALSGLGITLLPTFLIQEEIEKGSLVPILCDYRSPDVFLTLVHAPERHDSAKLRLLINFLYDNFAGRGLTSGQPASQN